MVVCFPENFSIKNELVPHETEDGEMLSLQALGPHCYKKAKSQIEAILLQPQIEAFRQRAHLHE